MRLTLAEVRRYAAEAAAEAGRLRVAKAEWIGKRTKERRGAAYFRVARVLFLTRDGRTVSKLVTLSTDGSKSLR